LVVEAELNRIGYGNRRCPAPYCAFEIIIVFAVDIRRAFDINCINLVDLDKARVKGAGSVTNFGFSKMINMVNF
jgi:hypothetical protein